MKQIPIDIDATVECKLKSRIPLTIYQTYKTNNVPDNMYRAVKTWIDKNPEFNYKFYDDERCLNFIKKHFSEEVVRAYLKVPPGAFRADFWRYCCLCVNGGVYADMDTVCNMPLIRLIKNNDGMIVPRGRLNKTYLFNAFICSRPEHPVLKKIIENAVSVIGNDSVSVDTAAMRSFMEVFRGGEKAYSENDFLAASYFALLGPLGLGRCVNALLERERDKFFGIGRIKIKNYPENTDIKILRFTKKFGILSGIRSVFYPKYDGYDSDQKHTGVKHWLS